MSQRIRRIVHQLERSLVLTVLEFHAE
jgi:hypothetical protein